MYTIKTVSGLTGVQPSTIRAWERRYALPTPPRSQGGYRLYDEHAVGAVARMAELVRAGWSASRAAEQVHAEQAPSVAPDASDPPMGVAGAALVAAAVDLDPAALRAELDRAFAASSFEQAIDGWLLPALRDLGDAWRRGQVDIAAEHFVSQAVRARLLAALDRTPERANGPAVLAAQVAGVHHDLGLLAFAVAGRRRGLAVTFVGADLPHADIIDAARRASVAALVTSVPRAVDVPEASALVAAAADALPGVVVAIGGAQQDAVPGEVVRLGHRIGAAALDLSRRLGC